MKKKKEGNSVLRKARCRCKTTSPSLLPTKETLAPEFAVIKLLKI